MCPVNENTEAVTKTIYKKYHDEEGSDQTMPAAASICTLNGNTERPQQQLK